jgi:hypothetical protein
MENEPANGGGGGAVRKEPHAATQHSKTNILSKIYIYISTRNCRVAASKAFLVALSIDLQWMMPEMMLLLLPRRCCCCLLLAG